ncbi:MAG: GlsB/YeaQ/YmgE family stress response membrane protein [Allobranchiibius sp.]
MTSVIGAIVTGFIVGALARLVMPGKQNIGCIMTTILGAGGAAIGSWLTYHYGYANGSGFAWVPFLVGVLAAVVLIAVYLGLTGRRISR